MAKRKDMKEKLGQIARRELERAEGRNSDELQTNRAQAMAYYRGTARGDEVEGRSTVISMDVADTTNAMLAMLRDMLILDAELVIEAEGEQDEAQAKAESDICSDVFLKDNPGERLLLAAIKDGLLLKNGCLKVRMEDGEMRVDGVPIENVSYTAAWDGPLQEVPFFSERIPYTRSELVELGVKKSVVDELQPYSDYEPTGSIERNVTYRDSHDGETRDQDQIECFECYILADMDGDGIAERYQALIAGNNECLLFEEVPVIPYALGSPFLAAHRLTGESVFDRVKEIQDSNTHFLRQWHDNVSVVNNGRYVYNPNLVMEEDIMEPKAGGGIRAKEVGAVVPLPNLDMTAGIAQAIDANNKRRSEAVGAALDMASAEGQLMNKSATQASIEKGNSELIASMVASNFALTLVKGVYALIHFHLRMYSERFYLARVNGQAVEVDPSTWPNVRRMHVRCGMSPGQKAEQKMALQTHLQLQAQAMMQGLDGVMASEQTLYRTQMRVLRMSGVMDPESLAIDPSSPIAQQARQQKAQEQQAMAQQMAAQQEQITQLQVQLEKAKLSEDARQHDDEIRFKYYDAQLSADTEETKLAAQGVIDLQKQRDANDQSEHQETERGDAQPGGAA